MALSWQQFFDGLSNVDHVDRSCARDLDFKLIRQTARCPQPRPQSADGAITITHCLFQVANAGTVSSDDEPVEPTDDPDTPPDDDATVTPVTAAPVLEATKTDALFIDADDNGVPSPGDTLLYQIIIINSGSGVATGVVFDDTVDPNTTLVNGTVQTSQGMVTSGNTPGDTRVAANVGTLPSGASVDISFRVTIDDPLPAGMTIYLRVQATGTVFGPWSDVITFETQLTAGAINAPAINSPVVGGTGPGGYDASINPTFTWGVIGGATNYEFQLAMDASFDSPIVDMSGADALGNVLVYKLDTMTLDYGTTYYWRVRAISATSETAWSAAVGFTTMAEPVETEPPVTVTDAPDVIITIPPADPAPTITLEPTPIEETPAGYIWAIIIIGAVLVIAVIVLIVRTRRSV